MSSTILTKNGVFTILLVLVFFSLGLIGIINHEMWRDELQAWLIARDSSSIGNLFENLKYELHPSFWHLCLYLITRFTQNPVAMQIFHLLIATGSIYIFARFAPFTRIQKILFSFGYFPFYEYAIISRNYGLGIFFFFLFCSFFQTRRTTYSILAIILFFLANTNAYGLIIALALGTTLIFEHTFNFNLSLANKKDISISMIIFLIGTLISIIQLIPTLDNAFPIRDPKLNSVKLLAYTIMMMGRSYIPIPNVFTYHFWNTNIIDILYNNPVGDDILKVLFTILSIGLFVFSVTLFTQNLVPFFAYIITTLGALSFSYLTQQHIGYLRHQGHLFIILIVCLWISKFYNDSFVPLGFINNLSYFLRKYRKCFISSILCINFAVGIFFFVMDLYNPFHLSKEVAIFIKNHNMENVTIVASYRSSPISGYLNTKFYYIENDKFGSFIIWDKLWEKRSSANQIKAQKYIADTLDKLKKRENENIILLLHYKLKAKEFNNIKVVKLAEFYKSIYPDDYYLYLVQPP